MAKTNPLDYVRQVRQETSKVTWPSRKETAQATVMVVIMSILAAIFLFAADQVFAVAIRTVLGLGA